MKNLYICTDGAIVIEAKLLTLEDFSRENVRAQDATDGEFYWIPCPLPAGLVAYNEDDDVIFFRRQVTAD